MRSTESPSNKTITKTVDVNLFQALSNANRLLGGCGYVGCGVCDGDAFVALQDVDVDCRAGGGALGRRQTFHVQLAARLAVALLGVVQMAQPRRLYRTIVALLRQTERYQSERVLNRTRTALGRAYIPSPRTLIPQNSYR